MINIVIVEDDINNVKEITEFLYKYQETAGETFKIFTFSDGAQIVESYRCQYDIILMDIELPLMDGMTAAEQIRKVDTKVIIMFITNMAQYAIRGYSVDALDYLLKPVSYFAFSERLKRAIGRMKRRETQYVTINTKGAVFKVQVEDIYWIESQGHRVTYHTLQGEYDSTITSMKKLEEELEPYYFFRCNNCYIVNLAHVIGMDGQYVVLDTGRIEVSRARRGNFKKALTEYMGEIMK